MTERKIREQARRYEAARADTRAAKDHVRSAARRTAGSKVGMGAGFGAGLLIGRSWQCNAGRRSSTSARLFNGLRALAPLLIWMNR